jgi:hypothetical protein
LIPLLLLAAVSVAGQTKTKLRPGLYIENRQGNHPSGPDIIGNLKVSKGEVVMCVLVEVYDESQRSSTACMLRFGDAPKRTLAFGESMPVTQDHEAYLDRLLPGGANQFSGGNCTH